MEHIAAILLIVGCSGNLEQCRELPAPVAAFETMAACAVERGVAVRSLTATAGDKTRIFSRCLSVDPALEDDYDTIAWSVGADGVFKASVEIGSFTVASSVMKNSAN